MFVHVDKGEYRLVFSTDGDDGEAHRLTVQADADGRVFIITFDDYPALTAFHSSQASTLIRDGYGHRLSDDFAWRCGSLAMSWCNRWQRRFDGQPLTDTRDALAF